MKNFKSIYMIFIVVAFYSCEKDPIIQEENSSQIISNKNLSENTDLKKVVHHYDYYGEAFEVSYTFSKESSEIIAISGDTEMAESILGNGSETQAIRYKYTGEIDPDFIEMEIFDSREELLESSRNTTNINAKDNAKNNGVKNDCYDIDSYGPADYFFYKDVSKRNLLIQGSRKDDYSIQWLGSNNDRISSLSGQCIYRLEMEITLYEHSCRTGKSLTFIKPDTLASMSISDLRNYTLSGWWFWRTSWNDQVSSFFCDVYRS